MAVKISMTWKHGYYKASKAVKQRIIFLSASSTWCYHSAFCVTYRLRQHIHDDEHHSNMFEIVF